MPHLRSPAQRDPSIEARRASGPEPVPWEDSFPSSRRPDLRRCVAKGADTALGHPSELTFVQALLIAGVQFRGKNAALFQLIYLFFASLAALITFLCKVVVFIFQGVFALINASLNYLKRRQETKAAIIRDKRNASLEAEANNPNIQCQIESWNREQCLAALILILCAWGRGARIDFAQQCSSSRTDSF